MKRRVAHGLQQDLLQPASPPLPPAPAGAGRGGPPQRPRPRVVPPVERGAPSPEWWVALQLPDNTQAAPLEALAQRARVFTPRVSLSPPDAVLLELRASQRLFGGAQALTQSLLAAFAAPCRVAFAPTPLAALVFARCGVPARRTDAAQLLGDLSPLPLTALRWPEDTLRRLGAVGVRTIGAVLRLPRAGFARRFGPETLASLDRLLGRQGDPRQAWAPPERFRRRCDPDMELADQAAVLTLLRPLCAELEAFLVKRQRGITSLAVQLGHRSQAPTRHVLRLAAPAQRATQLLELLELQLARLPLPAPVRRCELRSGPLVEIAADSVALWRPGEHGGGGAAAQMPGFIEQLRARLGAQAVSGLALDAGHRPERLSLTPTLLPSATSPAGVSREQREHRAALPWKAARRPLWLLSAPAPLPAEEGWPLRDGRRLRLVAGPERVESGWWDGDDVRRDYYEAVDSCGARLWVFRERAAAGGWFLHGIFA